jgi:pimeloyl-ACP methyl ester carboxylesterase
MPSRRIERTVELDGVGHIAVTVLLPDVRAVKPRPAVLFLFPGGAYGRKYFDLQLEGHPDHSQAQHHADQGLVTVTVDHLGVGDSTVPRDHLTLARVAEVNDAAVIVVLAQLRDGTFDTEFPSMPGALAIGAGQSMGGHLAAIMQANHDTFDGICALGSSFTEVHMVMAAGKQRTFRAQAAAGVLSAGDADMTRAFHWEDEPPALVAADMDNVNLAPWRSATVPAGVIDLLQPFAVAREAAAVRVPVLLIYGERDVTAEPLADAAVFRSTPDLAVYLVPQCAHMHNFAATRHLVWARLELFVEQIVALRSQSIARSHDYDRPT